MTDEAKALVERRRKTDAQITKKALFRANTRADSHHRLVEALEAFAFVGEDDPKDTQAVWEMIYRDRVQDWFSYEDFERARDLLAALKEAGRG